MSQFTTAFSALAICAWLGAAAWQDLRTRQVSNWLTLTPLLYAVAWRASLGDLVPLALLVAVVVIDPLPPGLRVGMMLAAVMIVVRLNPASAVVAATWAVAYSLTQLNVLGPADAKIAMTLIALFPVPTMAWCMAGAVFAVSLGVTVWKHRLATIWVVSSRMRDVLALHFPSQAEMESRGFPVAGAFALAFGAYLAYALSAR
jgi:Flp pilus assembly protein protease CpaA